MRTLDWIVLTIIALAAINWGLIGFFQFNLIGSIFGGGLHHHGAFSRILYGLMGLAGIYALSMYSRLGHRRFESDR